MASRARAEEWLRRLTRLPTASGVEDAVISWVEAWVRRRPDLRLRRDGGGNLMITAKGAKRRPPLLAVAHMDHPAFVITGVRGGDLDFQFRGGVAAAYFEDADVEVVSREGGATGRVVDYRPGDSTGMIRSDGGRAEVGDIAMWAMGPPREGGPTLQAPACDDLAGCAAALAALDRCRSRPELAHFGVLLTRAEEMGFIGAIHAARNGTVPPTARIISVETSRELPDAPIGDGAVIRTGDRSTVFDPEMTNRISHAAAQAGVVHQRKLMSGGGCEATAFGAYGFPASGLCVPLGSWHNQGNLDQVEAGQGSATPMLEEISLDDFHGLVELLVLSAAAVDRDTGLRDRLDGLYDSGRHLLG